MHSLQILGFFKENFPEIIWYIEPKFPEIAEIAMLFQYPDFIPMISLWFASNNFLCWLDSQVDKSSLYKK